MRKKADLYQKVVYWSDEDQCFIGKCPELTYGGVHGNDADAVFKEICEVAEEIVEIHEKAGTPLPVPKSVELLEAA